MSKKDKRTLSLGAKIGVAIIVIICMAGLSAALWYGFGYVDPTLSEELVCDEFYSNWMGSIKGDTKLNQVVMPGSHDAGCNGMMPQAMTQGHDIKDQLRGGVRYFDTRVTNKGKDLVIFHGPIKGQKFSKVIGEFSEFIKAHPTEFVIIDFQHLGDKCHQDVINMIKDNMPMDKMLNSSIYPDVTAVDFNILRANGINFMIVWKSDSETEKQEAKDNNFYIRDTSLRSEYDGKIHKKSDEALIKQYETYYANHEADKLFVLQSQRTAKTFFGKPSEYEKDISDKINKFVLDIKNRPEILAKTNIIMRDFVVSDMNKVNYILRLNLVKNLVIDGKMQEFKDVVHGTNDVK